MEGKLHEETAYGRVADEIDGKPFNLVIRKPLAGLSEKEIGQVRDVRLRDRLTEVAYEAKRDGKKLTDALERFSLASGIRRVRVLKTEKYFKSIHHGDGRFEKVYVPGANYCVEIFETKDGKWLGCGVSVFDANNKDFCPAWRVEHPDAKLKMRLHKGDLFRANFDGKEKFYVVRKLSPANSRIEFVPHIQAGKIEATGYLQAAYSKLKKAGAMSVRIDPIGRVLPVAMPS